MRNIVLLMVAAASSASAALADPAGRLNRDYTTPSSKVLPVKPVKGASAGHSCASYGQGFVKVEGTGTCVKVGGAVRVDVGGGMPH
jgi:hypothetical protein